MPSPPPEVPGLDLAARYVTGTGNVGGDWYDVFTLPNGKVGVVVGDVAGSGLQAAVIMGRMRSALRSYILETEDPADALSRMDRKIQYFEPDAMATVLYGIYDPETGEFLVSSAGHLPPLLAVPGRPSNPLPVRPDPPIGTADAPLRRSTMVAIPTEGLLVCYTDGLVERRDRAIDQGISLLGSAIDKVLDSRAGRNGRPVPLTEDACAAIMRALVGNAQATDDVALLVAFRKPLSLTPSGKS